MHTFSLSICTGEGRGLDDLMSDPQFDFLSFFTQEEENESVPDSFFINSHCSPYSNIDINCSYLDIENLQTLSSEKFTVLSLNIQSLPAKFTEFTDLISQFPNSSSPDVICIQETWQIIDSSLFPLSNYHPLETNTRLNARGGGVGIYIRENLSYKILKQYSIFYERIFESLFIELTIENNKKIIIGSVYCPPKAPGFTFTQQFSQFSEILTNLLAELSNSSEQVFIYGDFNLNVLELTNNKFISEYVETVFSFGFLQLVTKPTRINENSATLIDHILTNSNVQEHDTFILCSELSDHFPIAHQLNFTKNKQKKSTFETRSLSEQNIERFKTAINDYNWSHVTDQTCAQLAANNFLSTFDTLFNVFFPLTVKKSNKSVNPIEPWMSRGVLISRKQKNLLYKLSLNNPSLENKTKFKTFRNLYNQVIRTAKKLHFEKQLAENQKNLRKTWQILFSTINKTSKKKTRYFTFNN